MSAPNTTSANVIMIIPKVDMASSLLVKTSRRPGSALPFAIFTGDSTGARMLADLPLAFGGGEKFVEAEHTL